MRKITDKEKPQLTFYGLVIKNTPLKEDDNGIVLFSYINNKLSEIGAALTDFNNVYLKVKKNEAVIVGVEVYPTKKGEKLSENWLENISKSIYKINDLSTAVIETNVEEVNNLSEVDNIYETFQKVMESYISKGVKKNA